MMIDQARLPKTWDAGPALDDLVAVEIMGAKKERGIYTYWSAAPHWEIYRPELHERYLGWGEANLATIYLLESDILFCAPAYSSDIGWAFKVVSRMRRDNFSFKAFQPPHGPPTTDRAVVSFVCSSGPCLRHGTDFHSHHGAYDIVAETLPLGICKAALVALCKAKAVE